ncbi:MAG: hypothetical protein OXC60_20060 [Litoreibacter sp.]|nr:hypothetical protein [Litoreibacter sp.]MCY4336956.1 hypothetical protein [Litoreibacter sp.]
MQIALHLGAHCTDEGRLLRCLIKNTDKLVEQGILVADPNRYRPMIREALQVLKDAPATPETEQTLIDAMVEEEEVERIVLSHDAFLGVARRAVDRNQFYGGTGYRMPRIRSLFASCELELFIAIANPATFIPDVFQKSAEEDFTQFLGDTDPGRLRWSNLLARLKEVVPDTPITVWCNEDTPLIWHRVLRQVSGHDEFTVLDGSDDFVAQLMTKRGFARMRSYLEGHPPQNDRQRQRVLEAFLEKFARPDALEQEIDLPGWTAQDVDQLTVQYEADIDVIRNMPNVRLIEPWLGSRPV